MTDHIKPRPHATGRQIVSGAAWLMLFKVLDKSLGLLSTLVLARMLTPGDFGVVAMATAVLAFTQLMGAFGFDSALIQRQDSTRVHFDTAWTFNVIVGVVIGLTLVVLAYPAGWLYRDGRLAAILAVLALGAVVGGFENIGTVAFRKDLDFRSEFRLLLFKRVASVTVTMVLAFAFRTYWALVLGSLASKVLAVLISYRLHPYRPRLSLAARHDLMGFSKWIFLSSLIQFLQQRSTDFILGRTVGPHGLGVYNVGTEIAYMPSTEMIAPLNRAVYPAYARLTNDHVRLHAQFLEVFGIIAFLVVPVCVGLACLAEPALLVLLGPKWTEAIPIIRIGAFVGLVGALQSNMYLVVVAMGQPRATTVLAGTLLLVFLPIIVVASLHYGTLGAAWAQFCSAIATLIGISVTFVRLTGIPTGRMFAAVSRPVLGATIMSSVLLSFLAALGPSRIQASPLWVVLGLSVGGGITYLAATGAIWCLSGQPQASAEARLLSILRARLAP